MFLVVDISLVERNASIFDYDKSRNRLHLSSLVFL